MTTLHRWLVALICSSLFPLSVSAADVPVRPLPSHPGNIFVAGEEVTVLLPPGQASAWSLVDYDGKTVKDGSAEGGMARLGQLPVGYYELRRSGEAARTTIGVLSPLQVPTPSASPICIDVAMSWFYKDDQKAAVANLCALAGVNWVRDRLAWGEVEPQRGEFAAKSRYDSSAQVQAAAGLRVLQVNHSSPGWANPDGKRFPLDLRDIYRSYRHFAQRWKGKVLAFEPWNEADIDVFGGHTGAEMASLQKAAYWGLKAGHPDLIVCLNVFALSRRASLEDLHANEAWQYFETCNLHHYVSVDQYPAWYAAFRAISAGRPLWVSEFSMPVHWSGDEKVQEPTDEDLRKQAERVAIVMASSLHEGTAAAFYFMFPHYVEGKTQFGIVHRDLTPRPAYVAMAALGRLLADAKPIGKLRSDNQGLRAYLFRARPDGKEQEVLVAWATGQPQSLKLPVAASGLYDHLGRPLTAADGVVRVSSGPVYVVLSTGASKSLALEPAPTMPAFQKASPSPIVFQALWPKERMDLAHSAYRISSEKTETIPVYIYNFSDRAAAGTVSVSGPKGWKLTLADRLEIAPGERKELALVVDCSAPVSAPTQAIVISGDFGSAGRSVLSLRVRPEPARLNPGVTIPIARGNDPAAWQQEISGGSKLTLSAGKSGGVMAEATLGAGDRWIYPRLDLAASERPGAGAKGVHLRLSAVEGDARYRVIVVEESGASYISDVTPQPAAGRSVEAIVVFEDMALGAGWSPADPNGRLDPEQIKAIKIGCNTSADRVSYSFGDLRWVRW